MIRLQFNAGPTREALGAAKQLLGDMTPVHRDIGEYMIEATRKRFQRGEAPDGSKWPAKSAATLERYRRMGYGRLVRPLIGPGKALSRQIVQFVSRDGVVIGSSLIYSGVMQDGAAKGAFGTNSKGRPIPWGRIPARVWLGISAEDGRNIVDITDEHLERSLGPRA